MRFIERSKAVRILGLVLLVSACLALPAYFIYQSTKGLIIEELNKNAINIAGTAANFIEQDISAYKGLPSGSEINSESFDEKYYKMLLDRFEKIKNETGAANIFTEKRMPDQEKAYILDGSALQPQGPPLGSSKSMSEEELKAFNEGIMTRSGLMRDKTRGEFIAGYAPIIDNKTGQPIGIVGVEFTLKYAVNITNGMRNIICISFLVTMLLTTIVVYSLINSRLKYFKEDYLTGLFNKRFFEKDLKRTIRYARKTNRKLSLIMIDVDCFKTINDTLGHAVGDTVLKSVAKYMQIHIRHNDLCCRYGGDEFILTLINTDKRQANEIAERIRHEIMNMNLYTDTGEPVSISLSIGVAEFNDYHNAEKLIECADKAMYISKNTGKNKTTVYDDNQAA